MEELGGVGERGGRGARILSERWTARPAEAGLLARALLAAPGHALDLLPTGRARIDSIESITVQANGASRTVIHYDIAGLGFTPQPIWLDPDGTLFAQGGSWFMMIRAGWESAAGEDRRAPAGRRRRALRHPRGASSRAARRAWSRSRTPTSSTPRAAKIVPGTTVIVDRDRIVAVGPAASTPVPRAPR